VRERRRQGVDRVGREADGRDHGEKCEQPRLVAHEPQARAQVQLAVVDPLLRPDVHDQQAEHERQVRGRVEPERGRDPERVHDHGAEHRPDRARQVVGHRVERDRGREIPGRHELPDEGARGRRRERAADAEGEREHDHDPDRRQPAPREQRERPAEERRDDLRREQDVTPVESVGGEPGPRHEQKHRRELRRGQDPEQERRVGQPVDEERGGQVLEPGAARRQRVADEVGAEIAAPDQRERRGRAHGYVA
jgi:hypothetical protein